LFSFFPSSPIRECPSWPSKGHKTGIFGIVFWNCALIIRDPIDQAQT
jgi:hypothetical protein